MYTGSTPPGSASHHQIVNSYRNKWQKHTHCTDYVESKDAVSNARWVSGISEQNFKQTCVFLLRKKKKKHKQNLNAWGKVKHLSKKHNTKTESRRKNKTNKQK